MQNIIITVAFIFVASTAWACDPVPTPMQMQTQYQTQSQSQQAIAASLSSAVTGPITNTAQGGQGGAGGSSTNSNNIQYTNPREVLPALPVQPQPFPLLNGKVGEFPTRHNIYMNQCQPSDTLIDVVEVNDGGIISAIRYKDINRRLMAILKSYVVN